MILKHNVPERAQLLADLERLPNGIKTMTGRIVLWKEEARDGRSTKVPYRPGRPTIRAAVDDPATWGDFAGALRNVADGHADGLGMVLGDGLVGVDLDKCRNPQTGEIEPWALDIIRQLNSYTEISPSGTGLHVLLRGELPDGRRRKGKVEMYSERRYFTLTGRRLDDFPYILEERSAELAELHAAVFNGRLAGASSESAKSRSSLDPADQEILARGRAAKNGAKFDALWGGDISGYNSRSEADLALCSMLAFRCGGDATRVDRLFRRSGMMRGKWDELRGSKTYGEHTVARAVSDYPSMFSSAQEQRKQPKVVDAAKKSPPPGKAVILNPADPYPGAQKFLERRYTMNGVRTLHMHGGAVYRYDGRRYVELTTNELRSQLWQFGAEAKRWHVDKKGTPPVLRGFQPTTARISNLLDAVRAAAHLSSEPAPTWLDMRRDDPPPLEIVPVRNGLLHVPTRRLHDHSPRFFCHHGLEFAYEAGSHSPPRLWLTFLRQLWGDDEQSIQVLQEIMGYLLLPDTTQQKMFLLVGPPRSGKGTIGRILEGLLGQANVCGPTMGSLATHFGLAPLIGKLLATISDARLGPHTDSSTVVERLLAISGEDSATIDRKHIEPWTGRLPTRFLILTNELPRMADASGALASRFIVLTLRKSFFGQEDPGLTKKLLMELPAIFGWALDGLDRLRDRGYFRQPSASADAIRDLADLGSPISVFVRDRCVVGDGLTVPKKKLYSAWVEWCRNEGHQSPGTRQSFGRKLSAAVPGLGTSQPRIGGERDRVHVGIALTEAA